MYKFLQVNSSEAWLRDDLRDQAYFPHMQDGCCLYNFNRWSFTTSELQNELSALVVKAKLVKSGRRKPEFELLSQT